MSSPSELFSCVKAEDILRSNLNNSTAKNHWTMPKSQRFLHPKQQCDAIYNIPDTKSRRKTNFGLGKKTDLNYGKHPHNIIPSADTYHQPSFVELNKLHDKGHKAGPGRQQTLPMGYVQLDPQKVPGPGNYETLPVRNLPKWTMRPRTASQLFISGTRKIVPGPGKYQCIENMNSIGKYYTTKHKSSGSKVFNPKSSHRFATSSNGSPGVGAYNPKNDLSGMGIYVLSKNKSSGRRAILGSHRNSFVDETSRLNISPGPGSYRIPSDFGQYDQPINYINTQTIQSKASRRPFTSKGR